MKTNGIQNISVGLIDIAILKVTFNVNWEPLPLKSLSSSFVVVDAIISTL